MSNQTKGTTTNMTKLVSWDIDLYESMSDDEDCLIWLSQRDKYLLKNALRQVKWSTRWTSEIGTAQPDKEQISEEMAFKLSQEYCVDICDLIIECIDDPESGVSQAIINTVINSSSTEIIDSGQGQSDLIIGDGNNPACDLDILWGGINNLVDQLDVNNLDALQILEVATNSAEWATDVLAGVLGVKAPIINSVLEWALFIQESILENYEAQITTAYLDQVKCDLFCIAKENNCELTPTDLVDYFFDRLASQLTFASLLTESLEFIFFGTWTGSEIADAMMLSQLVFRAQFGQWFDFIAFRSIDLDMRLGFDDPSDDWELLCDECSATLYYLELDAINNQGGVIVSTGSWNSGEGFREADSGGSSGLATRYESTNEYTCKYISFLGTKTPTTTTGYRDLIVRNGGTELDRRQVYSGGQQPTPTVFDLTCDEPTANRFWWRQNSSPQNSNILFTRMRLHLETTVFPQEFIDDGWVQYVP